ncbi:P-loop containing nucleoside triphosphate hydrolase protein [Mycena floridula]|nr:P-loop containing nucleoside triphosphate hydrolase protein [Mycena floridula]
MQNSPTSISDQAYSRNAQDLIQLITELRALGAQADVDLPRIAVIGNQSAGKSSLVEAICKISVPRDSGTCTRCPMECRLSNSTKPWQCQVLLRFEKDESGKALSEIKEETFGPLLNDKDDLEPMLRRAQLAILNPGISRSEILNCDPKSYTSPGQLQFSSNVVCFDLSGTDAPDLSFIDLPGIISNVAEGEDRNNIELVTQLVKEHIQGNALILVTITMRDDIENQSAAFLARQADPGGLRTIGVLTKADTVLPGEHKAWMDVLQGARHSLHHGYYVTKQPDMMELKEHLEYDVARKRERDFFNANAPWSTASSRLASRIGVQNLTAVLSKLLSGLILKTLPKLRAESKARKDATLEELQRLPKAPSENPLGELLSVVSRCAAEISKIVEGGEGHEALIQDCFRAYETFRDDVRKSEPVFHAVRRIDASPAPTEDETTVSMDVDELRDWIKRSQGRQLPYNVPFSSKVKLVEQCFKSWGNYSDEAFEEVYQVSKKQLDDIVSKYFDRFTHGGLADFVGSTVDAYLGKLRDETRAKLQWLLELERPPFTLNNHYFSSYRESYLSQYKKERQQTAPYETQAMETLLSAVAAVGIPNISQDNIERLRGPDEYEEELIVMAEVRAYFHVSYKRIIDNVPRVIDHDFLRKLAEELQGILTSKLGLDQEGASQKAATWLSEDPDIVETRKGLESTKARLEDVLQKLHRFRKT